MKRTFMIGASLIVVILIVILGIKILFPPNPQQSNTTSSITDNNIVSNTVNIKIQNFSFSPSNTTIKKGTTVIWTNNDSVTHNVTFDSNSITSSSDLAPNSTFSTTINTPGTYTYSCGIHPNMKGTIVVTE